MIYNLALLLHSYTRWLVLIAMIWALLLVWWGLLRGRAWTAWETRASAAFAGMVSLQFILGINQDVVPDGLAQAALRDMGASMRVRELRFFGLEHPLQMFIAIGLVHMGQARARKAATDRGRFRWAAGAFTVATLLILTAIPWWRPLVRNPVASAPVTPAAMVAVGDAARGEALFTQPVGGQPACSTCHTLDETRIVGPGLGGVAARTGERVPGESAEAYLYNSIAHPGAFIVEGYANVMPAAYADTLTGEQLADLVAYLLTLRE